MPILSVVVSVHDAVGYLATCMDSLFAQTIDDLEIILVDDGSSDGSGRLVDRLGQDHANVRVVHRQRHCPGEARNAGMRVCTGDYLSFVNAYDWVGPSLYGQLLRSAVKEGADIVSSGHCDVRDNVTCSVRPHPLAGIVLRERRGILGVRRQLFGMLPEDSLAHPLALFVGASIYRRAFVEEHALAFEDVVTEDTLFSIAAYAHARCVSFICSTDYFYRTDDPVWRARLGAWGTISHYEKFVSELAALARDESDAAESLKRTRHTAVTYAILYVRAIESSSLSNSRRTFDIRRLVESRVFQEYCIGLSRRGMPLGERLFEHELERDNVCAVLSLARLYRMFRKGRGRQP